jgi:rhodanese-related sulfurtransferase
MEASTVSPEEARELVASNEVEVVDLSEDESWFEGHIPGAHHAHEDLDGTLEDLDRDRKLLIVCEDGSRSAEAAEKLSGDEWEACSLEGGMSAWRDGKLPAQPSEDYTPGDEDAPDDAESA